MKMTVLSVVGKKSSTLIHHKENSPDKSEQSTRPKQETDLK